MTTIAEILALALPHHRAGRLQQAEALYRRILQARPDHPDALHLLGVIAHQVGRHDVAVELIGRAIGVNPAAAEFHNNIGEAYRAQGRLEEAAGHYRKALALAPDYPEAYNNLGNVFQAQGRLQEADACYRRAIALRPSYAEAYNNRGNVLQAQDDMDGAVAHYRRALALNPRYVEAWGNLGNALRQQGRGEEAETAYRQGLALRPDPGVRIRAATVLPVIYASLEELHKSRRRVGDNLDALLRENLALSDPVREVGQTNFYLAYQAGNDRELQEKAARLYERACPSLLYTAPHCAAGAARKRKARERIRIGFVSRFFSSHSIGKSSRGMIANLSRTKFSVSAFFVPPVPEDDFSAFIRERADRVVVLPDLLSAARDRIAEEELDILYYQDIGMDPFTYFLAFARLAPVQCVRFGHPVTTGIGNMDYFLSTGHFEPARGQTHYSERLVRLKSIGAFYYKPPPPRPLKPRDHFGLEKKAHIYLCPQVLFKFHPDFDPMLAAILEGDPQGRLVLVAGRVAHWSDLLLERFARTMPRVADRVTVLPPQSWADFINLVAVSDVMLDTIHFGGFNSSLEAFALGTPVVTWPGGFMRGRQTHALYKEMGIADCVAESRAQYVRLALRLGTDPPHRKAVRAKILARNHVLYENTAAVREYERFFQKAVAAAGAAPARAGKAAAKRSR